MKKLDWLIVVLAVLLSVCPLPFLFESAAKTAASVRITQHGIILYEGALDTDARIVTPDGGNIIEISEGGARMVHADCADGLCLAAGKASVLRPIVCLPNEVTVTILSREEAAYDALTQ